MSLSLEFTPSLLNLAVAFTADGRACLGTGMTTSKSKWTGKVTPMECAQTATGTLTSTAVAAKTGTGIVTVNLGLDRRGVPGLVPETGRGVIDPVLESLSQLGEFCCHTCLSRRVRWTPAMLSSPASLCHLACLQNCFQFLGLASKLHYCMCVLTNRREKTPPEVLEARDRERELQELDRDIRTVFLYNLSLKAQERDIFELFSRAGKVTDVRIIMDRNTRKSKGFAYIEYANRVSMIGWSLMYLLSSCRRLKLAFLPQPAAALLFRPVVCLQEDIINALGLTGQLLLGQPVMVKSSEVRNGAPTTDPSIFALSPSHLRSPLGASCACTG